MLLPSALRTSLNGLAKVASKPALLWEEASNRLARRLNVLKIEGVPDVLEPAVQQVRRAHGAHMARTSVPP